LPRATSSQASTTIIAAGISPDRRTGCSRRLIAADCTDPEAFARHIVAVYRDPALWQSPRENALVHLAADNSHEHYLQALTTILGR
jgi:hypothetical protein